jgi:tetratricopeptide (TPR) repeat protein
MAMELVTNVTHDACSFGWVHQDRASTLPDIPALPDPNCRRLTSLNLSIHSPDDLFSRGLLFKASGDYPSAIEAFSSAIKLRWSFIAAYIEAGNCASLLRDFKSALHFYSAAIETDPQSPVPHYNIALTHADIGNQTESITWLQQTIEINPQYRSSMVFCGE